MTISSDVLGEKRVIFIYRPREYDKSPGNYPVLYLLDGEDLFNLTAAIVEYFCDIHRIPPLIMVGIESTDRKRDFIPNNRKRGRGHGASQSEGANVLLRFMQEELLPYVNEHLRTMGYRVLIGHSLGGLFAIHALLETPISSGPTWP